MHKLLKIALRIEIPSPESDLIQDILGRLGQVTVVTPWDVRSHTEVYDLAVCIGPVSSCPLSKKKILFVLGPTVFHNDLGWDITIVTSVAAREAILRCFGHGVRVFLAPPPLLCLDAGKRRLMPWKKQVLRALESSVCGEVINMSWWTIPKNGQVPYSPMEFNSMVRNGAYGDYSSIADGYDIAVRRHLFFGSPVVCERNPDVLGDLANVCFDGIDGLPDRVTPVKDMVDVSKYMNMIESIVLRML